MGIRWLSLILLLLAPPSTMDRGFEPVADAWGLEFRHHHGGSGEYFMPETMGSGVVIFDYDGDGDEDVFFVDSGALPGWEPGDETPGSRLFRNDPTPGGPRFVDVTERAGIAVDGYGMGATAGDVDGDGDLDLYVTAFGANQLFENRGDGTFVDVTAQAGVGEPRWSASAAFGDADGDGDLDLYVTNYVAFSFADNPPCGIKERGLRSYCHPDVYAGLPDRFYRNRGDGTFADATREAGFGSAAGKGLGVVWADLDGDGALDLYVANDMTLNFQFMNRGPQRGGRFEDDALLTGTAVSDLGKEEASMGIAPGDGNGDGLVDLVVTHLDLQTNAYYVNQGGGLFTDQRFAAGLGEPSLGKVGFGAAFADFDHDGDEDLIIANGHIIHNIEAHGTGTTYKQRNQLFENRGQGRFREIEHSGLDAVRASRGLALGDLDGDGALDVVISNSNDRAEVYRNVRGARGAWLSIDLRKWPMHGVGARVEVADGERRQGREIRTAASYLSQSAMAAHFGLGEEARVARIVVRGRDAAIVVEGLPVGRRLRLGPVRGQAAGEPGQGLRPQ